MRLGWVPGTLLVLGAAALLAPPVSPAGAAPEGPVHYRDQIAVLTYHDVSPTVPRGTDTVSPQEFAAEMDLLLGEGFHFVSVPDLERFVSDGAPVPPNAVCVVFDNGYAGIDRYALPVLARDRIPAAVFLIVANVGRISHDFTWREIQAMSQTGLVRFYTETYDLHRGIGDRRGRDHGRHRGDRGAAGRTPRIGRRVPAARLGRSGEGARRSSSARSGQPVDAMVYPYGQYTPELIALAGDAGYHYLFTTIGWTVGRHADPARLPRLDIGVWDQTPAGAAGAALTVAARASRRDLHAPGELRPRLEIATTAPRGPRDRRGKEPAAPTPNPTRKHAEGSTAPPRVRHEGLTREGERDAAQTGSAYRRPGRRCHDPESVGLDVRHRRHVTGHDQVDGMVGERVGAQQLQRPDGRL